MTDSTKYTPDHASGVNQKAVQAMQDFLEALGLDLTALGMEKTPYNDYTTSYSFRVRKWF
jgi:GTP cyclohydrolase I